LTIRTIRVLGLVGAPILDAKKARQHRTSWAAFAAAPSDFPFLAIIAGRRRQTRSEIGLWRIALGFGLFLMAMIFHRKLFGTAQSGASSQIRLS
jgi:uncharacterized membrane protein